MQGSWFWNDAGVLAVRLGVEEPEDAADIGANGVGVEIRGEGRARRMVARLRILTLKCVL